MTRESTAAATLDAPVGLDFSLLKRAVAAQWERMQANGAVFRAGITGDALWHLYLDSFPPGTNPVYRERREFDCSCCRQFVKNIGNAVAWVNGQLASVWDIEVADPAFQTVVDALAKAVRCGIERPFLHFERTAGTDKSFEQILEPKPDVKTWHHFFVNVRPDLVAKRADIPSLLSEKISAHDSFVRALAEISMDAIDTALDLIRQGSLYRGEEHRHAIEKFHALKVAYESASPETRELIGWRQSTEAGAVARIRASVIGTLLQELSEGRDLEHAVASFEAKVAPQNYKRPTALITKAMIDKARAQLEGLGLTSALERRLATEDDISVTNLLFVDRTRTPAGGGVLDELSATAPVKAKTFDKVEEVGIDKFIADIVPRAESLEVLLENRHAGNLVSLVTAADPTAERLFKWPNAFSWSYRGELADSIKERVKKAGGNIAGDLCCRLAWSNYDDLDFHMHEPGGYEISFRTRTYTSPSGGRLDIDMNAGGGHTREPVENIFYPTRAGMKEGTYALGVHQFSSRETTDVGFEVEIDYLGDVRRYAYPKAVRQGEMILVAQFGYSRAKGIEIIKSLPEQDATRTEWGLKTGTFHKVRALLKSPNHWDGLVVGNRHHFFMLEGCTNDGTARGFFNEFLRGELDVHRKVLEVVGAKVRAAAGPADQLSGLGFSSTKRDHAIVRVKGSFSRVIKVAF